MCREVGEASRDISTYSIAIRLALFRILMSTTVTTAVAEEPQPLHVIG